MGRLTLFGVLWASYKQDAHLLAQNLESFQQLILLTCFLPLSVSLLILELPLCICSFMCLIFLEPFFIFFSFCSSHWLISNYLSLSSLVLLHDQEFLLKFSIEFFSCVIVFLSCSISEWFFFMVSPSLLKCIHCSVIAFLILFSVYLHSLAFNWPSSRDFFFFNSFSGKL